MEILEYLYLGLTIAFGIVVGSTISSLIVAKLVASKKAVRAFYEQCLELSVEMCASLAEELQKLL